MTANVISQSEFNMKFDGIENKMMSISRCMRAEQTWNGENYTARNCTRHVRKNTELLL
jgi:hypothetical protein